jgi:hypothetical protein
VSFVRAQASVSKPLLMVDIDGVISLFGFAVGGLASAHDRAGSQPAGTGPASGAAGADRRLAGPDRRPQGSFHAIDGIPHYLSTEAAAHLLALGERFELVWASGWEEKAEEHLPHLLGLPRGLPFLSFERAIGGMGGAATSPTGGAATGEIGSAYELERGSAPQTTLTRAHWKLDAIDAYAGRQRPLAWIDDAFNDACEGWARARPGPTLLMRTLPETGLTAREAEQLERWARSIGAPVHEAADMRLDRDWGQA